MERIERAEELKRRMLSIISQEEDIPEEVISIIKKAFNNLSNRYDELRCNSSEIQEYLEGVFAETKAYITTNVGKNYKEEKMEQTLGIVKRIEKEAEEMVEENVERHREEIEGMDTGTQRVAVRIIDVLEDNLRDVQSRQNRILSARGYSDSKIEEIHYDIQGFIRHILRNGEEELCEALQRDDNSAKTRLLDAYEDYLVQTEQEEKESSKRGDFVKEIDANISLKEQREFAQKQAKQGENKKEEPEPLLKAEDYFLQ